MRGGRKGVPCLLAEHPSHLSLLTSLLLDCQLPLHAQREVRGAVELVVTLGGTGELTSYTSSGAVSSVLESGAI